MITPFTSSIQQFAHRKWMNVSFGTRTILITMAAFLALSLMARLVRPDEYGQPGAPVARAAAAMLRLSRQAADAGNGAVAGAFAHSALLLQQDVPHPRAVDVITTATGQPVAKLLQDIHSLQAAEDAASDDAVSEVL